MTFLGIILGSIMTLIVYTAYIFIFAFTLWMAVDAGKQDRFWWMVLIIGIPFIGSGVYFFTEKKHEYAKAESHHIHVSQTEEEHEVAPTHHTRHKKNDVAEAIQVTPQKEASNELQKEEASV